MSLTLAIALIVIADVAIIAGLAYVMSRAARLTSHVPSAPSAPVRSGSAYLHPSRRATARPRPETVPWGSQLSTRF